MTDTRISADNLPIEDYLYAGFPIVWVRTSEVSRAISELASRCASDPAPVTYTVYSWDCVRGYSRWDRRGKPAVLAPGPYSDCQDPVEVLAKFSGEKPQSVLFLHNYHRYLMDGSTEPIIQSLLNFYHEWASTKRAVVIVGPRVDIPIELEKHIIVTDFGLPSPDRVREIIKRVCDGSDVKAPTGKDLADAVEAATGLADNEVQNAVALSITEHGAVRPDIIYEIKVQTIKKSGLLMVDSSTSRFADIGGLDNLKRFMLAVVGHDLAKGALLLGVPGTGKSEVCKALGNEIGRPSLSLDMGKLFGSLVGESEAKVRDALRQVDAMAPCILRIDEIEKGLSGVASSHMSDGGTGSRVFGTFLNWLNDHTSHVYVVATCNDISKLPPEFTRAERWDTIFFVDLPSETEREKISEIYKKKYGIKDSDLPDTTNWTGAEIKALYRLAHIMSCKLRDAAKYVVPIIRSSGEMVDALRRWAKDKTVPASDAAPPADIDGGRVAVKKDDVQYG